MLICLLLRLFFRIYHYPEEWIGLRKNDTNGEGFYWLDGTALDHVNWQLGEPTANGDCVIDATEFVGDGWKVRSMICNLLHSKDDATQTTVETTFKPNPVVGCQATKHCSYESTKPTSPMNILIFLCHVT